MNSMISVASGFQYSVNIGYDLNSDDKLQNFIPTKSTLSFIGDILSSTNISSTNRARILIGAYGKGKSHIVLTTLALLMKKDISLFTKLMPKVTENPALLQIVKNYYDSDNKLLPVVISGSNTSMTQAFLLALQRTLSDNGMLDIMPESNYKAAVSAINRWKAEFPDTYAQFRKNIDGSVSEFVERLDNFDISAYEMFERIYPELTAGSVFNPFLGFDIVELYENVAIAIKQKGYSGLFVVYDEFSKYLEANITAASVSDVKMLQDFAEKCNRSGKTQLHLLLISHKEISNYIDKLPQQKVDGWRGVSERFTHIHLNNNFSQTYEIISSVIQKDSQKWSVFCDKHQKDFSSLMARYEKHALFTDVAGEMATAIYGCYPLHPVSTFILPRLSEKVAQNERTLFTFLSADGASTLSAFVRSSTDNRFNLLTPDLIYDYFEPLFKNEAYASSIHTNYVLTSTILAKILPNSLESKIVKTISLIYILEQYERIAPTVEEIVGIYSTAFKVDDIQSAIDTLIEQEYVVYLKRSNGFLRLKKTSGVDVKQKISDLIQTQSTRITVKEALNASNFDNYMYPSRYNDEHEMTRFFAFEFIDAKEVGNKTNWNVKSAGIQADGVIYAIIPASEEDIPTITESVIRTSAGSERSIFIIPKHFREIESVVREFLAVNTLKEKSSDDPILFEEYEVIYEDLHEIIKDFMNAYTHPEEGKSVYLHNGQFIEVRRKAALTELMSRICETVYSMTPVINNEAVNRNDITNITANSRNKIIAGLLRNELEAGLGLSGTGQEVSIMRSTLIRTGILEDNNGMPKLNLHTGDEKLDNLLLTIENFIIGARHEEKVSFEPLYNLLCSAENHIGLRLGLVPIYLAVVLHEYKQRVVIMDKRGQIPLTVDALIQINAEPSQYSLAYVEWNQDKEEYLNTLANAFADFVIEAETRNNTYEYVANAMKRWYMDLPKYSKECKRDAAGKKIHKRYLDMIALLRQNVSGYELLFKRIPEVLGFQGDFNAGVADTVVAAKNCYDALLTLLKETLIKETKAVFVIKGMESQIHNMSLASVGVEWCETLDKHVFEQMFTNGAEKCLELLKNPTNDESALVARLAKLCTDLRIEDWASDTLAKYVDILRSYRKTAEEFHAEIEETDSALTSNYQITYIDNNGVAVTKRFDRVEYSNRGKLLMNQVRSALDAMGRSISEQEKRQVLMEVLEQLF